MDSVVIITDSKIAASIIAQVLGDQYTYNVGGIDVHEIKRINQIIKVTSVTGHLTTYNYTGKLSEWNYTNIDELLSPLPHKIGKRGPAIPMIRAIVHGKSKLIIATSNTADGESIGYEISHVAMKYCNIQKVHRMRYNSLETVELKKAFKTLTSLDKSLADSADVMNTLEYMYSTIMSRIITSIMKTDKKYLGVFSVDPCQIPLCGLVYDQEEAITRSEQSPFFEVIAKVVDNNNSRFRMVPLDNKSIDKTIAKKMCRQARQNKKAKVQYIESDQISKPAPAPFNLPTLLYAGMTNFKLSANEITDAVEKLYLNGHISDPYTYVTEFPEGFNFTAPLENCTDANRRYSGIVETVLETGIKKRGTGNSLTTPIYPTMLLPYKYQTNKVLSSVFGLIFRNYVATTMDDMIIQQKEIQASVGNEGFNCVVNNVIDKGWGEIYPWGPEYNDPEIVCDVGDILTVDTINMTNRIEKIKPFTLAELYKQIDENQIVTPQFNQNVFKLKKRDLVGKKNKSFYMTPMGHKIMKCFDTYAPALLSFNQHKYFMTLAESVASGDKNKVEALEDGKNIIRITANAIMINTEPLKTELCNISNLSNKQIIGRCQKCGKLQYICSYETKNSNIKHTVLCSNYPKCAATYDLPTHGSFKVLDNGPCPITGGAVLSVNNPNKKPYTFGVGLGVCTNCTNSKCVYKPKKSK